jgi:predicted ATP-grasp superfamily ATP-dependent carboligase
MPDLPRSALVVTVSRARGALAAVRALGRAGWTVGVGTPEGGGMLAASRWCHASHVVPRPRGNSEAFVEGVRAAVAEGGYSVVFGGADDWVAALATHRDRVPARVAHPGASTVESALDKQDMVRRAAKVGFRVPETEVASPEVLAAWDGPLVVKCRSHWSPGQRHLYRIDSRRYPDARAAAARIRLIQDAGLEPLVQRPVDGHLGALIGLFDDGRLLGRVQQRTLRLWPTPSGVSSRAQTVPVDDELAGRAVTLLSDLGWSGLVELQFLTGTDGVPQLIDLNGRFYGSMALACAAGPNLPDAWGRQALGLPMPALEDGLPGVRYVWTAGDVRRAFVERQGGLMADVGATLRWVPGAVTSVWDRRDARPVWHLIASRFRPEVPRADATALGQG